MTKKQNNEAASTARFRFARKALDMVNQTNSAADIVKSNPQYGNQPLVQTALAVWVSSAADIGQSAQEKEAAKATMRASSAKQSVSVAAWKRATRTMMNVIDTISQGSDKTIKDWGFEVTNRVVAPADTSAPETPRIIYDKHMEPTIRWKAVRGHKGYNLQIADASAPTGWGSIIQLTQSRYKLSGTTPGQKVEARVAVVRKNGVSPYSSTMTETIR